MNLFKEKKKIKTMNNKMAKNTYLSTIESTTLSNQKNRDRIMDMESILMAATWDRVWGNGGRGEGTKKYK